MYRDPVGETDPEQEHATWRVQGQYPSVGIIASDGRLIATLLNGATEEDMQIIAAAPEMRELLREVTPDGVTLRGDGFDIDGWLLRARGVLGSIRR